LGALTAALIVTLLVLRRVDRIYEVGQVFPRPSGYSIDMRYVPPVEAPCYLIRMTADDCPYCQLDQSQYGRLVEEAQRAGCQVLVIGPRVGDVAIQPDSDIVQLQYVDMGFGRVLDPFGTPQTILLDQSGKVTWHRQGSLKEEDLTRAVRKIARLR
jgi:hypothetical protein